MSDEKDPTSGFPRLAFVAIGLVFVLAGAGLALFTQPRQAIDTETRAAIVAVLDKRIDAMWARDLDRYMSTVDPARLFLRDCEQQRFEARTRLGRRPPTTTVGDMDTYLDYVRVWVLAADGWERVFMRSDGYRWYVSEPTSSELGDERTDEYAGVRVTYREVEADLAKPVGREIEAILPSVIAKAPSPPARLFSVRIATLTGTAGRCFIAGEASGYAATTLTLRVIQLTERFERLSLATTETLLHEALHWVQFDHSGTAINAMDWWLVEGWPVLIANTPSLGERTDAVCAPGVPTYSVMRIGPGPRDLYEIVAREYVVGAMLVERLDTRYGAGTYWQVMDAFASTPAQGNPYVASIGIDGQSYYAAWLSDARAKYCQ